MKIAFVGHVCVDKNVVRGKTEILYGGGVMHGGITAQRLGMESIVVTKCADADRAGFGGLAEAGVQVNWLPSPTSTSIQNVYPTENPDDRESRLISRASPFTAHEVDQIAALRADVVHVNPLWFGEFPPALLAALRPKVQFLAADAQGFLRVATPDGRMAHEDLSDKQKVLAQLDLLKVDAKEALVLTGINDPRDAARAVKALGPRLVLLTHRDGLCVCSGEGIYEAAFRGFTLEGRTGRGDTCTASFLAARGRGMSLPQAADFAADITSRKMQYPGPFRG